MRSFIFVLLSGCSVLAATPPPLICASGGAVATVDLRVVSPSRNASEPLPLRTIAQLEEGDTILYKPILRAKEVRRGDVTFVLVPANKKEAGPNKILVFSPRPAQRPQEWKVPWRASLAAFVYGPSGLDVKKVEALLDRDDQLIAELADYADKTAKAEALISALSSPDSSRETVNAALQGFSSKFGAASPLSRTGPVDLQAAVAFRTLDPSISAYDPLAGQGAQPIGETAGLATSVGEMFLGSQIGLAAGGTALLLNLRAIAFPKTEFRSTFSQSMPENEIGLCAKTTAPELHTRIAYIWAMRIPNAAGPKLKVAKAGSLPAGIKSPLPLTGSETDWKYLDRARNWTLQPDRGKPVPVKVQVLQSSKSIELDPGKEIKPGRYTLSADWDWDRFEVGGFLNVRPLPDFKVAKLTPETHDRLTDGAGKVVLTLEGADFEFVTKLEIKKPNDEFSSTASVPYVLPQGIRMGVQSQMDFQLDASSMHSGAYQLLISQVDGKSHEVPLTVLPPPPSIDNLPLKVNVDISEVSFDLKGKRLDLLRSVQLSQGTARLGPASADGTQRPILFSLQPPLKKSDTMSLRAVVAGRDELLEISKALQVTGPRPLITGVKLSAVPPQSVHLDSGELPAALTVSAMIGVADLPPSSSFRLECEAMPDRAIVLHPGDESGGARLERLTDDQFFLTFDTAAWMNGCVLRATIESGAGNSAPRRIGRIVRLPSIEQLNVLADDTGDVRATLQGIGLETIAKAGWTALDGTAVVELPQPLSADGHQRLELSLPLPPSTDAVLYVWLRGGIEPSYHYDSRQLAAGRCKKKRRHRVNGIASQIEQLSLR